MSDSKQTKQYSTPASNERLGYPFHAIPKSTLAALWLQPVRSPLVLRLYLYFLDKEFRRPVPGRGSPLHLSSARIAQEFGMKDAGAIREARSKLAALGMVRLEAGEVGQSSRRVWVVTDPARWTSSQVGAAEPVEPQPSRPNKVVPLRTGPRRTYVPRDGSLEQFFEGIFRRTLHEDELGKIADVRACCDYLAEEASVGFVQEKHRLAVEGHRPVSSAKVVLRGSLRLELPVGRRWRCQGRC